VLHATRSRQSLGSSTKADPSPAVRQCLPVAMAGPKGDKRPQLATGKRQAAYSLRWAFPQTATRIGLEQERENTSHHTRRNQEKSQGATAGVPEPEARGSHSRSTGGQRQSKHGQPASPLFAVWPVACVATQHRLMSHAQARRQGVPCKVTRVPLCEVRACPVGARSTAPSPPRLGRPGSGERAAAEAGGC
jgi:hypothetical protein